ncbi:MAG: neutral zinc metallopeptidase, partial [Gemmatimonadales bacterium]|nr:neutral zinc metallopeptidase [Gemmatimonadales bacterium]
MRWSPGHRSANVEDRRGGGGRFIRGAGGMGVGTLVILLVLSLVFKRDFFSLVGGGGAVTGPETAAGPPAETTPEEEQLVSLVSFVLDDAQTVWQQKIGSAYRPAKLVLFRDAVQSACGFAEAASGPFYCPSDEKAYIDLGFYEELQQRFG